MSLRKSEQHRAGGDAADGGGPAVTQAVPPYFSCRVLAGDHGVVLALRGELDVMSAAQARQALLGLELRRGDRLMIDLRELEFMDSTGVRLILQALDWAERHGATLALIRGPADVHRVLEVVGLADQLLTFDRPRFTTGMNSEA
jgi:anti-sigma B factor antagonist